MDGQNLSDSALTAYFWNSALENLIPKGQYQKTRDPMKCQFPAAIAVKIYLQERSRLDSS
jgi:hypothetical protein